MPIKKGDFVELDYTGRIADTKEAFDTTEEAVAKAEDIYDERHAYAPFILILGDGNILAGIDEHLEGKEPGKHTVALKPEQAFGRKDAKLIQLIPTSKFKDNDVPPMPGLRINVDGNIGTIKSVSGGRTLVDFNHPLAGRELVYDVNVRRIITDLSEQARAMAHLIFGQELLVEVKENVAHVTLPKTLPDEAAAELKKHFLEHVKVKDVQFEVAQPNVPEKTAADSA